MIDPLIFLIFQACFEPLLSYAEPFIDKWLGALVVLVCIEVRSCSFNLCPPKENSLCCVDTDDLCLNFVSAGIDGNPRSWGGGNLF